MQSKIWSDFLASSKVRIIRTFTGTRKHFSEDTEARDTYNIRIERIEDSKKGFNFSFGDSIHNTEIRAQSFMDIKMNWKNRHFARPTLEEYQQIKAGPTDYTILSCISYDSYQYDTFQDFCDSMGYDTDSRKALETYLAYQEQATKINRFFTAEELEQLREIQ